MDVAGGPEEPLGKVLDFMRLIWALDHGLQSLSKRMHNSIGLTGPQRVTLRVVGRMPGISAGALAGVLRLHPSTLTGILDRLVRRGLVRRTRDPKDGRRAHFALTPRGRRLDVPSTGTIEAVVRRVLARIPEGRLHPAAQVLAAVAAALLQECALSETDRGDQACSALSGNKPRPARRRSSRAPARRRRKAVIEPVQARSRSV